MYYYLHLQIDIYIFSTSKTLEKKETKLIKYFKHANARDF